MRTDPRCFVSDFQFYNGFQCQGRKLQNGPYDGANDQRACKVRTVLHFDGSDNVL